MLKSKVLLLFLRLLRLPRKISINKCKMIYVEVHFKQHIFVTTHSVSWRLHKPTQA